MLWAVKIGAPDWQEEIITTNPRAITKARKWAEANGFNRFRVSEYHDGERPDFAFAGKVNFVVVKPAEKFDPTLEGKRRQP